MKNKIIDIIRYIGENPNREGLLRTPERVIKSWEKLYGGYKMNLESFKTEFSKEKYNQMISAEEIPFYSTCEHHLLPFFGKAYIAYIPNKKILGLSKLSRILEMYARRIQVQERLTDQIADAIEKLIKPKGCGVMLLAQHFCVMARGVEKQEKVMRTCSLRGIFQEQKVKEEFLSFVRR